MKSIGRPFVLVVAGAVLALVSGAAVVEASLHASSPAGGAGRFPVVPPEGMAPGAVPALALLVGLLLIGLGAAVHDGRELRGQARGGGARPPAVRTESPGAPPVSGPVAPRLVHVITTLPARPVTARAATATARQASATARHAPAATHRRRTSSGARLELVGAGRRS